ncbi:DUF943 family protein [Yokenella regensburgei]|jgi:hypothetical protein|uniref:Enterobacterial putative membrane protein (DUF943) n=1 Tax=Yokenella regensburgei TaxID=158877 RepID=A0AB38FVK9_9ENTR|nr:DUF943 family protein [Yokenella regensburgei]SQA63352.1 Enterobacterial putative membrane protein (DUF943) [Yokenella regensburgei]SQA68772.1 Enterobacterial putative membrane protein (DUF943) [Yokenella regensburgei]SUQ07087.1 Enterobacterial putative membrane protein (DUF943) [Yokenella regensburgei]
MKPEHWRRNLIRGSLLLLICGYLLWAQRPVTIIRAGERFEYEPKHFHGLYASSLRGFIDFEAYDIAVDHLALTEWGRIHWYLEHKTELKKKYRIPLSHSYRIVFWDIGGGFINGDKSGDGDLFCFTPQKNTNKNCIEKNIFLSVEFDAGGYEKFYFDSQDYYWITMSDGKLVRIKNAL